MEEFSALPQGTVDPEVRAYVTSLVTALGGTGGDEDGRYVLGDDALACLRDIKRWLRLYDEKLNRLDVARVLAERNLVKGDLLEIIGSWPDDATEDRVKSKIMLSCFELLVPLTWPMEKNEDQATANHYRNYPYLQLAQIGYKREILEHPSSGILRAAVRIALPSLALPADERTTRDEGILKLVLYFLRNIALITAPDSLPVEWNENEVSASATIKAFHEQDIFAFLLTLASNIEEFGTQDVVLMETLFHLVKGVPVDQLFLNETQLEVKHSSELRGLMKKEASMLRGYSRAAPTRHNRFGTMIWMKREDDRVSSVSGQDVLSDGQRALKKLDESKRVNRPVRAAKEEKSTNNFNKTKVLSNAAIQPLRSFVEEFLDSSFNPLFHHLRRALEREDDRVLLMHWQQYFYLLGWFLQAERMRRKHKGKNSTDTNAQLSESNSYSLVASVLNQETFILVNRFMDKSIEHKVWLDVNAVMRGFTQILLTVQEMAESPLDEDQEIADNIQNRIFYEETTHEMVLNVLRGYKDQGFSYLDACTELTHVFLRLLERYSKENLDLQVRSRRRARKAKTREQGPGPETGNTSETEEVAEAQRISKERKFDFNRFAAKFATQNCVDTFISFLKFYQDLSKDQLKRAHRYLHRVAFKQELSVMLFRLDIVQLLHSMTQGPKSLDNADFMHAEWHEFAKQVFRRLTKKMQERPALAVEMLFSKISSTTYYLEYGYEKQTTTIAPKAAAELEVKGNMSWQDQIGVVVAALHEEHMDAITFVVNALRSAAGERQSWEAEAMARNPEGQDTVQDASTIPPMIVVRPDNEERRMQMFKNGRLRLLMKLIGMEQLGINDEPNSTWIFPSEISSQKLAEIVDVVEKHRADPRYAYGEDQSITPEQMLRRKTHQRPGRFALDDDSDGIDPEEEFLFPAGGPTVRKPDDALAELKKRRRKRRRSDAEPLELDEETLKARRVARKEADLERRRKIKSTEFVVDSDDEDDERRDEDFFAAEKVRERDQALRVEAAMRLDLLEEPRQKRKRSIIEDGDGSNSEKRSRHGSRNGSSDPEGDELFLSDDSENEASLPRTAVTLHVEHLQSSDDESETPPSSQMMETDNGQPKKAQQRAAATDSKSTMPAGVLIDDDDDANRVLTQPMRRQRGRAVVDDEDEDD